MATNFHLSLCLLSYLREDRFQHYTYLNHDEVSCKTDALIIILSLSSQSVRCITDIVLSPLALALNLPLLSLNVFILEITFPFLRSLLDELRIILCLFVLDSSSLVKSESEVVFLQGGCLARPVLYFILLTRLSILSESLLSSCFPFLFVSLKKRNEQSCFP